MPGSSYLVDTNIRLRFVQPDSPDDGTIRQCTDHLWAQGAELFYTSQNLAEFWNVCARPADRNGFGFSVAETDERAALIESKFSLAAAPLLQIVKLLIQSAFTSANRTRAPVYRQHPVWG